MGRWMEIVRHWLPPSENQHEKRRPLILGEIAPNPLMEAVSNVPRDARQLFPLLDRARVDSGAYDDEQLWLDDLDAVKLLEEFRQFRRVSQREAFVTGLKAERLLELWRGSTDEVAFKDWLDRIEDLLELATREKAWVLLLA
ncbi:MAG TPA: hypothetical protein VE988_26655 [Gemmataceae bacterium]|nr:hypothetical protein [Gemmataceae bacterium]